MSDLPPGFVEDDAPPPGFVLDPPHGSAGVHSTAPAPGSPDKPSTRSLTDLVKGTPASGEEPPGAVETFFRKASNAVSSNLVNPAAAGITHLVSGQPYQEALQGINASDQSGAAANPKAALAGTVAGTGLQMAAPLPVPKGLSPAAAGAVTGAGFGAVGGAGDALNAGGGAVDALSAAGKGALGGAAVGGAVGGVLGKLVRGAPERVEERIASNIARGEAGGVAGKGARTKVTDAAEAGKIMPQLEATGLTKVVATQAAAKPGKVASKVEGVVDKFMTERIDPAYELMDKAGSSPRWADVKHQLLQLKEKLRVSRDLQQAEHVDRYTNFVDKYIGDDELITASGMRKMRREVGVSAFPSKEVAATKPAVQAQQEIYHAIDSAIEAAAARTPGVDLAQLKAANKTVSTLLTVKDALVDRASKAAAGGTGIGHAISGAIVKSEQVALAASALHALTTNDWSALGTHLAEIGATEVGRRVVGHVLPQAVRRADYGLSRLELGARAGDTVSRAGRAIIEGGAARVVAPKVGRAAGGFLSPSREEDR